jgi:ribosomal protein S18 acetylase RimI-like enzyme
MTRNQVPPVSPELNLSDPSGDDFEALSRDRIPVRSMTEADLSSVVAIDKKITGRDRTAFYKRKMAEVLRESGIRVSLAAELEGAFAGFLMARVDFGEFGRTEATAIIETMGVSPGFAGRDVGRALLSQLLSNLSSLKVEQVTTTVEWDNFQLLAFLKRCGFHPSQRLSFSRRIS